AGPALIYWRAFAGTAVPESRICYGGESVDY
ncbi:hypothetical protein Q604_UNBC08941G0001, partial [human gut metagenome]